MRSQSGRYEIAIREAQRGIALQPTLVGRFRFYEALAHLLDMKPDTCLDLIGESSQCGLRAMCQHSRGEVARSMESLDSFKSALGSAREPSNRQEMLSYRDIAMFYAWIGEVDQTLDWLERAFRLVSQCGRISAYRFCDF